MENGMDMKPSTKTRVQRRVEKKQVILLAVLVVVIVIISFGLGVIVGRNSTEVVTLEKIGETRRVVVADAPKGEAETPVAETKPVPDKLTFYDNLSKDDPAPIGSGINLPPDEGLTVAESFAAKRLESAPVARAEKSLVATSNPAKSPSAQAPTPVSSKPVTAKVTAEVSQGMPLASKGGAWVVQVFSSQSAADAGMLRDNLSGKGYQAFIAEADLGKKGIWYRVYFGPYAEKAVAERAQFIAVQKDKLKGFVKRR